MPKKHNVPWRDAKKDTLEWKAWIAELEQALGFIICGAQNRVKSPGPSPCTRPPAAGRERCSNHGGATPIGPANPHWIDGRRSKLTRAIPERYRGVVQESMDDPELISCRHALSMLQARREELYLQLDTGESGEAWAAVAMYASQLAGSISEAKTALEQKNPQDLKAAFDYIEGATTGLAQLAQRGLGVDTTWKEIKSIGEHERKQRRQEQLLLEAHQHSIERERANALFMRLLSMMQSALTKHVPAEDVRKAIMAETSDGVNQLIMAAAAEAAR